MTYYEIIKTKSWLKIDPETDIFDWLDDLLIEFNQTGKISIDELNESGSRNGRKTYASTRFIAKLIAIAIKKDMRIACYGFREFGGKALDNLQQEIQFALDDIGFERSDRKTIIHNGDYVFSQKNQNPRWSFNGGSFISLQGINQSTNKTIALKGLASCNGFDLAIRLYEEANEMTNEEFQAVTFAIRGAKATLDIKMCNPDLEYQDFVAYCIDNAPYNREELTEKGYQFRMIRKYNKNKVFFYTNYQINPFLSDSQIKEYLELKELDPIKYDVWGIGMPGRLQESIFGRYIDNAANDNSFRPINFTAGVDIGQADSPTGHPSCAELVGIDATMRIKPIAEYFHWNAEMIHKDPNQIATDIVTFFINEGNKNPYIMNQGLTVYVDYGSGGLAYLDIMKSIQSQLYPKSFDWLSFKPVNKEVYFIKDRIDATISLLVSKQLLLDPQLTPWLVKQMKLMVYKKPTSINSSHKIEIIDLNDDTWDALCYSIMRIMKELIQNISYKNKLLVRKEF